MNPILERAGRGHLKVAECCFEIIIGECLSPVDQCEIQEEAQEFRIHENILLGDLSGDFIRDDLVLNRIDQCVDAVLDRDIAK